MKKLLIIIIFFGSSFGQDILSTYPNGSVKEIGILKDGERDGLFKSYFDNGELYYEEFYINGKLNGPFKVYHYDRNRQKKLVQQVQKIVIYKDDKEISRKEFTYHGIVGYGNGRLHMEDTYKDGKPYSRDTYSYEAFYSSHTYTLSSGYRIYKSYWNLNLTQLRSEVHFSRAPSSFEWVFDGTWVFDGPSKSYYKNGAIKKEKIYKDDKRNGLFKSYYENGAIEEEKIYKDDRLDGLFKSYYKYTGKLKKEETYKNDRLIDSKEYYENGKEVK